MVDALEAVRKRLRRRGILVDIAPDITYQPAVSVRVGSRRVFVGVVTRAVDENVLAAHLARDRVLADGRFRLLARGGATFHTRHDAASFERELADNANWSLPRGFRARLTAARRSAGASAMIDVDKRLDYAVLRRP